MGQIPRSTERISSLYITLGGLNHEKCNIVGLKVVGILYVPCASGNGQEVKSQGHRLQKAQA